MTDTLSIALSKGRIYKDTLPLLAHAGIRPLDDPDSSRKLILDTNQEDEAGHHPRRRRADLCRVRRGRHRRGRQGRINGIPWRRAVRAAGPGYRALPDDGLRLS